MRSLTFIALALFCYSHSLAEHSPTKQQTIKWLRAKLTQQGQPTSQKNKHHNYSKMCINVNLHYKDSAPDIKHFTDKIESAISWKQGAIEVQNNIFKHGKLRETYTYQIPLTAIESASVTNCQRNAAANVNAYADRPIFLTVKKGAAKVGLVRFDKDGNKIGTKEEPYHMNSKDGDWESVIPIAGNWDSNPKLLQSILNAFNRLNG